MKKINPKHTGHIVAVSAGLFAARSGGFCDYTLDVGDIIIARRHELEEDDLYRQVLPIVIFTHQGKVWAYRRSPKGGEARLHGKIAVAVGGHWDFRDIVSHDSVIDLNASLRTALAREIAEEVNVSSHEVSRRELREVITADDTPVDRKHVALVTMIELDGTAISSREDELESLGFLSPDELLSGDYQLETWARLIAEILKREE
jgi:predicted NUDIX family phosphoesterase